MGEVAAERKRGRQRAGEFARAQMQETVAAAVFECLANACGNRRRRLPGIVRKGVQVNLSDGGDTEFKRNTWRVLSG